MVKVLAQPNCSRWWRMWMSRTWEALFSVCFLLGAHSFALAGPKIVPPLRTSGHQILDARGHRVRLTSVNWYGFDQKEYVAGGLDHAPLQAIVKQIKSIG